MRSTDGVRGAHASLVMAAFGLLTAAAVTPAVALSHPDAALSPSPATERGAYIQIAQGARSQDIEELRQAIREMREEMKAAREMMRESREAAERSAEAAERAADAAEAAADSAARAAQSAR